MAWLKRVPWIVWALLAPAIILGGYRLIVGGGRRIPVVGSGAVSQLVKEDAPEGIRLALDTQPNESLGGTRQRLNQVIRGWPDILVFSFDAAVLDAGAEPVQNAVREVTESVENAAGVPVVVGFSLAEDAPPARREAFDAFDRWFREELCPAGRYRVCVDVQESPREAIAAALGDAVARHDALRATTQVGR